MEKGPEQLNNLLIATLQNDKNITRPEIADAFRKTYRHDFLPGIDIHIVYQDKSVAIKKSGRYTVSSSTRPRVMARMLEQLELQKGQNVLEIGTGTGYNAALISELVGSDGYVTTVDIDPEIVGLAQENIHRAGKTNVTVICADGWYGWPKLAPYDRIVFTVRPDNLPLFWQEQLISEGIFLLPIWLNGFQRTVSFRKRIGVLFSLSVKKSDFMSTKGVVPAKQGYRYLNETSSLITGVEDIEDDRHLCNLYTLLSSSYIEHCLPEKYSIEGIDKENLAFYAGLRGAYPISILDAEGKDDFWGNAGAIGIFLKDRSSLFLVRYHDNVARQYGAEDAMRKYIALFDEWWSKGKPGDEALKINVVLKNERRNINEEEVEFIIERPEYYLTINYE